VWPKGHRPSGGIAALALHRMPFLEAPNTTSAAIYQQKQPRDACDANKFAPTMSSPFTCIEIAQNISAWEEALGPSLSINCARTAFLPWFKGGLIMRRTLLYAASAAVLSLGVTHAFAQSGGVEKAVGGYDFAEAAKEAPGTKNFHSADGHLTFAIVTHTAGNGFFDPVYVGATVAGNMIGAKILLLGSESPVDDPAREIEILNQIVQDPTIDGIIMTTPQVGAYNDIVKAAEKAGIPIATTNSFDATILHRSGISHTGQDASAAAIGGEALAKCVLDSGATSGSILLPSSTAMGNVEVNNRVTAAFNAIVKTLKDAGKLDAFKVDAGPENVGIDTNPNDPVNALVSLFESRGDAVGAFTANNVFTPPLVKAVAQMGKTGKFCAFGFDLGPAQQEGIAAGNLTGSLGQQPFLQGFWPVMQLYLQIDRGISAANLDTRAQLVTKENVAKVGKRFEN
jgi:simple sugar transport system substrate-binding protein